MDTNDITRLNREAWNEATEYHERARGEALRKGFADPEFTTFTRPGDWALLQALAKIKLKGKTIAQLPCNNGRELISLLRLGAGRAVGFDLSDAAVAAARELAAIAKADIQFVQTDVLAVDSAYDRLFDFIYVSEGSLQWFPSLDDYFAVVARLLKPGGRVLVFEMHPFAYFFEQADASRGTLSLDDFISYFEPGPYSYADGMDYAGGVRYPAKPCSWFMHQLSEIINAVVKNGLEIEEMSEYNVEMANNPLAAGRDKFPLSYILSARKKLPPDNGRRGSPRYHKRADPASPGTRK